MRDINRIKPFCDELAELWMKAPDMRFGQFMSNVLGEVQSKHGDFWYFEEDKMLKCLKEIPWLQDKN